MRYDVVIIGAGMSGLAAGIRLAHFGKKTLILDRHYRAGGLNSFYRKGGYDMDVGLHAVTNYRPAGPKSAALPRLLRRLRIRLNELDLSPQISSRIDFPGARLDFTNDIEVLTQHISEKFPGQEDGFRNLSAEVSDLYANQFNIPPTSGRERLGEFITEPLLVEMLMAPLMFYGCSSEDDMDFAQLALLFMSVYQEGFARPRDGIRPILDLLAGRFKNDGGELRLRAGVERITVENGKATGVTLDDGEHIECGMVLSSAGLLETGAICPEAAPKDEPPGRMSFIESINFLDSSPEELGLDSSIIFFSKNEKFVYRKPDAPVDVSSGVICVPGNFQFDKPMENQSVRITNMADFGYWDQAGEDEYAEAKEEWRRKSLESTIGIIPDVSGHIKYYDLFTPKTIKRFTGHINGAVYGSPRKIKNGVTPVENLYICGTDQGYLGVVGSMISGVEIATYGLM